MSGGEGCQTPHGYYILLHYLIYKRASVGALANIGPQGQIGPLGARAALTP